MVLGNSISHLELKVYIGLLQKDIRLAWTFLTYT